ncbi:MAG: HEAT repeat domain-containing protein, partial [Pirellulales bacterium]|nr:HEAT repeat domain-containing protein [Pirellulales bacterium]
MLDVLAKLALATLLTIHAEQPRDASPDAENPQQKAAERWQTASSAAAALDSVFLGKPLRFWIEQAAAAAPLEPRTKTVEALILALDDETPEVRVAAGDALGHLAGDAAAAIPVLARRATADESAWVRSSAAETLAAMGPAAVPQLIETFRVGEKMVRIRASAVLAAIGADARSAVPVLKDALRKEPEDVRSRVAEALASIAALGPGAADASQAPTRLASRSGAVAPAAASAV